MERPLLFVGLVLIGLGTLEIVLGPVIARIAGMPSESAGGFVRGGIVAVVLGAVLVLFGMAFRAA